MNSGITLLRTKILNRIFVFLLGIFICSCVNQRPLSSQQEQGFVNYQVFYDQLSPYGQWANSSNYGYVWIPGVGSDFSPYSTAGHWVMTQYGWTWASDYDWGWAPFHYGRWDYDNYYGWFWVPDYEWGPSWVNWRNSDGYYGWTPMRPGTNTDRDYNRRYKDASHWNFVRYSDFGRTDIDRYYLNRKENGRLIRNSSVIDNTYIDDSHNKTYISGPPGNHVEKVTGKRINSVVIHDNDRPGQVLDNDQLRIYRPEMERRIENNHRSAPSVITNLNDVAPVKERNDNTQRNMANPSEYNRRKEQQAQPQKQTEIREQNQRQQEVQPQNKTEQQQNKSQQEQSQQQNEIRKQGQRQQEIQPQNKNEQQIKEQPQKPPQQQVESRKQDQQQIKEQPQQPTEQINRRASSPSGNDVNGRQQNVSHPDYIDKKMKSNQPVEK